MGAWPLLNPQCDRSPLLVQGDTIRLIRFSLRSLGPVVQIRHNLVKILYVFMCETSRTLKCSSSETALYQWVPRCIPTSPVVKPSEGLGLGWSNVRPSESFVTLTPRTSESEKADDHRHLSRIEFQE